MQVCAVHRYLSKRFTQIYRAQYADAILVSFRRTPAWRSEINENIWNSLLLKERLLFPRELVYTNINTSPNTLLFKLPRKDLFSKETALSRRHLDVTYWVTISKFQGAVVQIQRVTSSWKLVKRYIFGCSVTWGR